MLKFPSRIKNYRKQYTIHTIVPVDRRDNSCVWNNNSVLRKSVICVAYSVICKFPGTIFVGTVITVVISVSVFMFINVYVGHISW